MERRFEIRLEELLNECEVPEAVFDDVEGRLREFVEPFAVLLCRREQGEHAQAYVAGLLSQLPEKNVESIAYFHDQDRWNLQHFLGSSPWDHRPLVDELARQVGETLGETDGVLVFDPSGYKKSGHDSIGVDRQWLGRFGKVDNGQVGIYLAYVSRQEHALVDVRLYLPKSWSENAAGRKKCGVPREVRFRTRQQLALEMLAQRGPQLPHAWIAGDEEMGRSTRFRRDLRELNEPYLLGVPSNTVVRDLEKQPPPWRGSGSKPKRPFEQAREWTRSLPRRAWTRIDVRDGQRGPLVMEIVKRRVQAKTDTKRIGPEELLLVTRRREQGKWLYDYYLSNAPAATPLAELARVAKAEHRVEECIQRAKSETGLADYEVRNWLGWHHHQTMGLMATWFLVQEARREKKYTPAITLQQVRQALARLLSFTGGCYTPSYNRRETRRRLRRTAKARLYHWRECNRLAPLHIHQRR
jgi:SRSO17 transposase